MFLSSYRNTIFNQSVRIFSKDCFIQVLLNNSLDVYYYSINAILKLFAVSIVLIQTIDTNWRCGRHVLHRILCHSENSKGVYCLQYDDQKIVSGLRDNTIKVCTKCLTQGMNLKKLATLPYATY